MYKKTLLQLETNNFAKNRNLKYFVHYTQYIILEKNGITYRSPKKPNGTQCTEKCNERNGN